MKKLTKDSSIFLEEKPATMYGILGGATVPDMYSMLNMPARAIPSIEGIIRAEEFWNTQSLTSLDYKENGECTYEGEKDRYRSDAYLISLITRTAPQSYAEMRRIKLVNPNCIIIAGGPHATFSVEECLTEGKADIVVIGEGDRTIKELINILEKNPENLNDVDGIAFRDGENIIYTKPRKLLTPKELGELPLPYYNKRTRKKVGIAVVETSRGCNNDCDFCSVTTMYGRVYRPKPDEYVIKLLENIKGMGKSIFFTDDNLANTPNRAIRLFEKIKERGLGRSSSGAQVTIRSAKNPKLLRTLKNAGVDVFCIGVESLNNKTLDNYNKPYAAEENKEGMIRIRKWGGWTYIMTMPGGDGDTLESMMEDYQFYKENADGIQPFPPTPLPGTRLFKRIEKEKRFLTREHFLYDGHHVTTRHDNFTPLEHQEFLHYVLKDFYSKKESIKRIIKNHHRGLTSLIFYHTHIANRINDLIYNPQAVSHLNFLRNIS